MVAPAAPKASLINANLGPYAIEALVGRGAMGAVYLARDRVLHRKVALKVLLGSLARNQEAIRQFRLEAQAAAPLRHPNIVRIYEAGIREGTPFIAMEYIEGESLELFLQRTPKLAWPQALHIAAQVAAALACAHDAGIVHRDAKPANMLIDRGGRIRLTDFGIANREGLDGGSAPSALGTLEYMAPEQLRGEAASPKSDLFALGVVLYRMLSGQAPFAGGSPEALIHAMLHGRPTPLRRVAPDLPDDVARLTMRLLEESPAERPAHGREVIQTIERLQREEGGGSAMPEALDAFIREQSRARRIDSETSDRSGTGRDAQGSRPRWRMLSRRGLGVAATVFACAAAAVWAAMPGMGSTAAESPLLDTAHVRFDGDSVSLPLNGSAWRPQALAWDAQGALLTCLLTTDTALGVGGRQAVLELDFDGRQARYGGATSSPWDSEADDGASRDTLLVFPEGRAGGGLPQVYFSRWPGGERDTLDLFPRNAGRHGPEARPVLAIAASDLPASAQLPGQAPPLAVHGPKRLAAVVLRDGREGGQYVAVVELRHGQQARDGRAMTASDSSILPGPLRFSPDGNSLYFFRHGGARERSLWRLDLTRGAESPVAVGAFDPGSLSISPDGAWVALRTGSGDGEITVYPVEGGQPVLAGSGTTGPGSWLPGGQGLVVSAADEGGMRQALRVSLMGGVTRTFLTDFEEGIAGSPAVSPDGRRVAVAVASQVPRIELVNLSVSEGEAVARDFPGEHHAAAR